MTAYGIEPLGALQGEQEGFPDWDCHPLSGRFAHQLYPTVAPQHQDHSFCIKGPEGVLLLSRLTVHDKGLSFYGLPAVMAVRHGVTEKEAKKLLTLGLDHMNEIGREAEADRVLLGGEVMPQANLFSTLCIDRQAKGETQAWIVADLRQDVTLLKRDVRDSFRSLINWGERNMTLKIVNQDNPDRGLFDLFPAFHADISGRGRGAEYWDVYWREIQRGKAEVMLGWLADGSLVSGSIVVGAGETAYYASGVYARDQFDKPLGHWPLWNAMVRAQAAGYHWFDAGEIPDYWSSTEKEGNISFFKRGFSSRRALRMRWTLPILR